MIGSILFPATCVICGKVLAGDVEHICLSCRASLPLSGQLRRRGNSMEQHFEFLPGMEMAAGWMYYRPGSPSARLLEKIKYSGMSALAGHLGRVIGREALDAGFLEGIDGIQPVPLHILRRLKRGYNQSEMLARGVSDICKAPVLNLLKASRHSTQTSLSASARRNNVKGVFSWRKSASLPHKPGQPATLLLIDDVCTTGATLAALAEAIEARAPETRFRFLTLAVTDR